MRLNFEWINREISIDTRIICAMVCWTRAATTFFFLDFTRRKKKRGAEKTIVGFMKYAAHRSREVGRPRALAAPYNSSHVSGSTYPHKIHNVCERISLAIEVFVWVSKYSIDNTQFVFFSSIYALVCFSLSRALFIFVSCRHRVIKSTI